MEERIIGKHAVVKKCGASRHTRNNGCVCDLVGQKITIGQRQKPFCGVAAPDIYHIVGQPGRVIPRRQFRVMRTKTG